MVPEEVTWSDADQILLSYKLRRDREKGGAAPKAVREKAAPAPGIYVQAGVFKKKENADSLREQLFQQNLDKDVPTENVSAGNAAAKNTPPKDIPIVNWYNAGTYRVWLGPYASHQDAVRAIAQIKQALGIPTFIVNQ